jgi:hypothetical protein
VSVADSGDFARQLRAWNATEAYRLIAGEWRIVHSRWAFPQTAKEAVAS